MVSSRIVRRAVSEDIKDMVKLSSQKRMEYEKIQPTFWCRAENADVIQSMWFHELLEKNNHILLVSENSEKDIDGFIIGKIVKAPEVYNPGGFTLMVDDFCVASEENMWKTVGSKLLTEIRIIAKSFQCVQIVIVCGHHDIKKRDLLKSHDCLISSEWYVGTI